MRDIVGGVKRVVGITRTGIEFGGGRILALSLRLCAEFAKTAKEEKGSK